MWESDLKLDKYIYVRDNPLLIKTLGLVGLVTTLIMAYGFWKFFHVSIFYLIFFGPIVFIFIVNKVLRYAIQLFYPKFDIERHEEFVSNFWATHEEPSVDIFLPWAGEDLKVHEEVVKAVNNLNYKNFKVYMLDDGGLPEHKSLADKYKFNHLQRPNRGEFKKSGNLQYGYDHSSGEFVFILDADFIPTRDSLHDLIPYIASDNQMGILQTPQYFEQTKKVHKRSAIEFGGGNIVEEFYKINLPCRDVFRASMCVGTSAIYRRTAIMKLEGTPKVHASEDLATGLLVTQHGYYVKYLPLICSMGTSPETFQGYFKQHQRWCSGNIVFAKYWPQARLNPIARIIYLSNPSYYLAEALGIFFSFQFLALLYFNGNTLNIRNVIYFLPYLFYSRVLVPLSKTNKNKLGTRLAALSNAYTYIYTYIHMIVSGVPKWHPTGVKITKMHKDFLHAIDIGIVLSSVFIISFLFVIFKRPQILGNYNAYLILGWAVYSAFWHGVFLFLASRFILQNTISDANSPFKKIYLYTKSHLSILLIIILFGALIFNATIAFKNPDAPTVLALNELTGRDTTRIALNTSSPTSNQIVVAPNQTPATFKYKAQKGDSLTKLAVNAIRDYEKTNKMSLTAKQENFAAAKIVANITKKGILKIGDEIDFDPVLLNKEITVAENIR